jgi:hypothetical protein
MTSPSFDRGPIETGIDRVRSLDLDELRTLWRVTFRSSPPPAFTKARKEMLRPEIMASFSSRCLVAALTLAVNFADSVLLISIRFIVHIGWAWLG